MPAWLAQIVLLLIFLIAALGFVGMVFGRPTGQGRRPDDGEG